ncbi:ankyrin repeat domain-containing protein [Litoribaculum gwangyangense]|uniref:Ankyrin repeat domain-containing protein n=2 Tax=Litoribaculum gwangyangense TaxID=1130722 RepID=A0ABP9CEQ2_9FLAO
MMASFLTFKTTKMNETELFFNTIQSGNTANLELQLKRNPNLVNAKDGRGFTPLIFATYFDKEAMAKLLIEHQAPLDAQDASGNTALIGVCFKGNVPLASFLIEKGANINAVNNQGATAIIFSSMYNKLDSVQLLLKHNADKTIKDNNGKTALDYAKEKDFDAIVSLLT